MFFTDLFHVLPRREPLALAQRVTAAFNWTRILPLLPSKPRGVRLDRDPVALPHVERRRAPVLQDDEAPGHGARHPARLDERQVRGRRADDDAVVILDHDVAGGEEIPRELLDRVHFYPGWFDEEKIKIQ